MRKYSDNKLQHKTRRSGLFAAAFLFAAICAAAVMTGCSASGSDSNGAGSSAASGSDNSAASDSASEHEPITLMDAQRDYQALIELVHEKYPEINIDIVPYRGRNMSAYMKQQLETGIMPDIYSTTQAWDPEYQKEHLIDLSHYDITNQYVPARLDEYTYDGGLYLLPYDYSITGILYNKSLFERLGLAVPESFEQLKNETIPALKEHDVNISDCLLDLPGAAFQYFFNISAAKSMNTLDGRRWRDSFTDNDSDTFASDNKDVLECADYVQQWIDCGMLNHSEVSDSQDLLVDDFSKGNTAFLVGSVARFTQEKDGSGDSYGIMPYLSPDGDQNIYITTPARFYGLNKELAEPGNEQKLTDALHVLEVLSTNEGYAAITKGSVSTNMCSIRDFEISPDSPYALAMESISLGHSMNKIYVGWENYLVTFGESVYRWISGEQSMQDTLSELDETKVRLKSEGVDTYGTVTEELNTVQAAQLSGQIFMEATGADAALISYNVYSNEFEAIMGNSYGANGTILPGELTDEHITIFLPTGWYDTLITAELSGKKLMEMAAEGCDVHDNGFHFPYVLLTADGKPVDEDKTYTVVLCGYNKSEEASLGLNNTGIVGLDAAKEYLLRAGEISSATLDDSLLQSVTAVTE